MYICVYTCVHLYILLTPSQESSEEPTKHMSSLIMADQGIELAQTSIIMFLHIIFNLPPVGRDIHNVQTLLSFMFLCLI